MRSIALPTSDSSVLENGTQNDAPGTRTHRIPTHWIAMAHQQVDQAAVQATVVRIQAYLASNDDRNKSVDCGECGAVGD